AHAVGLLQLFHHAIRTGVVGLHHHSQPRGSGNVRRAHRDARDGNVAAPHDADGPVEREHVVVQQHGQRMGRLRHRAAQVAAAAGAVSIGSDSEPPGGIIGNTFASCSITSSTNAGPRSAFASASTSPGSSGRARWTPIAAGTANPIAPRPPDVTWPFGRRYGNSFATHIWCWPTSVTTVQRSPVTANSARQIASGDRPSRHDSSRTRMYP